MRPVGFCHLSKILRTNNARRFRKTSAAGQRKLRTNREGQLEREHVTALGAATVQNLAAATGARTNEKAVRASTLDLGRLISTLRSHDKSLNSQSKMQAPTAGGGHLREKIEALAAILYGCRYTRKAGHLPCGFSSTPDLQKETIFLQQHRVLPAEIF